MNNIALGRDIVNARGKGNVFFLKKKNNKPVWRILKCLFLFIP